MGTSLKATASIAEKRRQQPNRIRCCRLWTTAAASPGRELTSIPCLNVAATLCPLDLATGDCSVVVILFWQEALGHKATRPVPALDQQDADLQVHQAWHLHIGGSLTTLCSGRQKLRIGQPTSPKVDPQQPQHEASMANIIAQM